MIKLFWEYCLFHDNIGHGYIKIPDLEYQFHGNIFVGGILKAVKAIIKYLAKLPYIKKYQLNHF
jgi:hypothetical protein